MTTGRIEGIVEGLGRELTALQALDLDSLTAREVMALQRAVEPVRRRLDHATDRLASHLDTTGARGADGHRTAKAAIKHVGRLPGAEAHGRVQTARGLRLLPAVEAAYGRGEIPTASVRAIATVASNPRVQPFLDDLVDKIFAEQASEEAYDNVIIDAETLDTELARIAGDPDAHHDPARADHAVCRTSTGHPLHPSDAVAALLVGWVRRVVVDAASNVIDLGRRRRLFTGSSREAVELQTALRRRGGSLCFWSGCSSPPHRQQRDHVEPWRSTGRSDVSNGALGCGFHNRLKEAGFRPVRRTDGRYDLLRPDGTRITPPS